MTPEQLDELERVYMVVSGSHAVDEGEEWKDSADALYAAFPSLLALARDGVRYRWLRDRRAYVAIAPHSEHVPRNQRTGWTTRLITGNDENMDAAIDAAMKERT